MYIEPNGLCYILADVPLTNTYEHTLWFNLDNPRSQYDYFVSKRKHTLTNMSYTRYTEGVIVVQRTADQLYDCNYLMFQNTGFGNKWFYAFITSVEYVNNKTSYVYFQIDVMQTWHFDYNLKQCFVEREHTVTDEIGDNVVPENLEHGDYVTLNYESFKDKFNLDKHHIMCAMVTREPAGVHKDEYETKPPFLSGVIPVLCRQYYEQIPLITENTLKEDFKNKIEIFIQDVNTSTTGAEISGMFIIPKAYLPNLVIGTGVAEYIPDQRTFTLFESTEDILINNRADGNVPRNNKLKTYPYCCYIINTDSGAIELKYELTNFEERKQFTTLGVFNPQGKIAGYPLNYGGAKERIDMCINLDGFPQLSWINDGYQNWLAENSGRIQEAQTAAGRTFAGAAISSLLGGARSGVSSGSAGVGALTAAGGLVGGYVNYLNAVGAINAKINDMKALPDTLQGSINGSVSLAGFEKLDFYLSQKSIRPEFVTIIDDFFTRFGYAVHELKVPNRNSRPHFNYVKTVSSVLTGSMPADDMRVISSIYDNGITFWKHGDEVGNYDLDNRP